MVSIPPKIIDLLLKGAWKMNTHPKPCIPIPSREMVLVIAIVQGGL
jgi:hypothetical protein